MFWATCFYTQIVALSDRVVQLSVSHQGLRALANLASMLYAKDNVWCVELSEPMMWLLRRKTTRSSMTMIRTATIMATLIASLRASPVDCMLELAAAVRWAGVWIGPFAETEEAAINGLTAAYVFGWVDALAEAELAALAFCSGRTIGTG